MKSNISCPLVLSVGSRVRVITAFEIKVMIKVKHQLKINVLLGAEKYSVVQNVIEYKNS